MTLCINGKTYEAGELVDYVKELEKENAELKKQLVEKGQLLDLTEREWGKDTTKLIHSKTQLTKAKEIINEFLSYYHSNNYPYQMLEILDKAEQFISEVEK